MKQKSIEIKLVLLKAIQILMPNGLQRLIKADKTAIKVIKPEKR